MAAEIAFGPPPTEKIISAWHNQEDQLQSDQESKYNFREKKKQNVQNLKKRNCTLG